MATAKRKRTSKKVSVKAATESSYKGSVTVKFMRGKEVYRTVRGLNNGMAGLFNFLASCLGSNYVDSEAPRYVMGFNVSGDSFDSTTKTMASPVRFSSISVTETDSSASLTFVIPGVLFVTGTSTNAIALYGTSAARSGSYESPEAWLKLSEAVSDVGVGDNVAVIWKLTVSNK